MKKKIVETIITVTKTMRILYDSSKIMYIIALMISFLSGITVPVNLWIWKNFIDNCTLLLGGNISAVNEMIKYLLLHLVVVIIDACLENISVYVQGIFGSYVDMNLTKKSMTKIEQLQVCDFDNAEIFNTIQKASNESLQRSISILQTLIQIIKNISSMLGTFCILFIFSKLIIFICFCSIIPIFYINKKVLNKWFEVFNSRFEKIRFAKYLKSLCIKYDNIKELKIFDGTSFIKQKVLEIYDCNIQQDKKVRKNFLVQTSFFDTVDILFNYLIKGIVIYISFTKHLTIGSVITYIQGVDVLKGTMKNIMSMITKTYEDSLYMQNFFSLLNIKTECEDGKKEFETNFKKIEFKNVSFQYPETKEYVLKNINYTFEANKTYALVGLNGSGKTTFIKLLLNLYEVSSGEILIDGINIINIKRSSLYKNVSAIFQDFIKYPFDVRTNITIGDKELNKDDKLIDQIADFVGAKDFIDKLPNQYDTKLQKEWSDSLELSLGQWQKLAIARASIRQSSILILDEPTASIDAVTEFEIFNNFKFLKKNKLCILVTHRFSSIKIVDEILVLEGGILKENGSHDTLIKKCGLYKELYTLQADAYKENEDFVSC